MRMPCRYPTRHTRRAGSLPEPDKATLFAVHIFSDKTTEKAQSFYPMVMQNCQLPLDERRKPENCLVTALLPVLKKRECVGALSRADAATRSPQRRWQTRGPEGTAGAFSEPSLNLLGAFPREPSREGRPRRC